MPTGELLALFRACSLIMRRDVQTCLYLMPYVIHNVLKAGSKEGRQRVKLEIEAVLRDGHTNREGELCVQAIFSLLDMLKKWSTDHLEQAKREDSSSERFLCRSLCLTYFACCVQATGYAASLTGVEPPFSDGFTASNYLNVRACAPALFIHYTPAAVPL